MIGKFIGNAVYSISKGTGGVILAKDAIEYEYIIPGMIMIIGGAIGYYIFKNKDEDE